MPGLRLVMTSDHRYRRTLASRPDDLVGPRRGALGWASSPRACDEDDVARDATRVETEVAHRWPRDPPGLRPHVTSLRMARRDPGVVGTDQAVWRAERKERKGPAAADDLDRTGPRWLRLRARRDQARRPWNLLQMLAWVSDDRLAPDEVDRILPPTPLAALASPGGPHPGASGPSQDVGRGAGGGIGRRRHCSGAAPGGGRPLPQLEGDRRQSLSALLDTPYFFVINRRSCIPQNTLLLSANSLYFLLPLFYTVETRAVGSLSARGPDSISEGTEANGLCATQRSGLNRDSKWGHVGSLRCR